MLENPKINIKHKLSALWASLMALYIYGDYFELYVPDKIEKLMAVSDLLDTPVKLFFAAFMLAIPALMIALSVLLEPKLNRILNILFGVILTIVVLLVGSSALYTWYSFYVFYAILEAIVTLTIIWYAWKWPTKQIE